MYMYIDYVEGKRQAAEDEITVGHFSIINFVVNETHSRKRGPFPQKSDCKLDLSADSAKSVVHARENRLTLEHSVPKLQSFEYHTRA